MYQGPMYQDLAQDRLERAAGTQAPAAKVAYLVNVYPKISHSFIQTEIEALERLGIAVERFTIRRSPEGPDDRAHLDEVAATTALLAGNLRNLARACVRRFMRAPLATIALLRECLASHREVGPIRACAYFAEAAVLADELQRRGVRHVHVHFGTNAVSVARLASRMMPLTYSFTAHGPDEFDAPVQLDLAGKIADASFVVGVSSFGRGQLMRWSALKDWPKIQVVRCAVAPRFAAAALHALPYEERARFVCVARLSAQKGLPILIEAAAQLRKERSFTIDIVGDGEDRDAVEALIAKLGLQDTVKLLGWRTPGQIVGELETARALVLPSFAEGLPVVLMEAMALGRPVIATHIAGIPELVDHAVGWLIPSGSIVALAAALRDAIDTSRLQLQALGEAGCKRVREMHDADANARALARDFMPLL